MALTMWAIFIAVGAALLELFSFMFLVFGLLLIWTALDGPLELVRLATQKPRDHKR
jgi:predicted tellurium resistance membrane protein TerC